MNGVPPVFEIGVSRVEGLVTLTLHGELDLVTAPALEASLFVALATDPDQVVLEMGGLSFVDCAGSASIARAVCSADASGRVVLLHPSALARRVLEVAGLDELCVIRPSRDPDACPWRKGGPRLADGPAEAPAKAARPCTSLRARPGPLEVPRR